MKTKRESRALAYYFHRDLDDAADSKMFARVGNTSVEERFQYVSEERGRNGSGSSLLFQDSCDAKVAPNDSICGRCAESAESTSARV